MAVRVAQTTEPPNGLQLFAAAVMRGWIRSGWRGSTGGPMLLARYVPLLHALPVALPDLQYVYVDLRDGMSRRLLGSSPWNDPPSERSEQEIMRRVVRPGDVIFDIGAHMGLHTVLLSALTGDTGAVHAFEVNPSRRPSLRETIRHLSNATLHEFGLADRIGRTTLYVPLDQTMASLADWTKGRVGAITEVTADVQTLDSVISSRLAPLADFVKCDVEGAGDGRLRRGCLTVRPRRRPDRPIRGRCAIGGGIRTGHRGGDARAARLCARGVLIPLGAAGRDGAASRLAWRPLGALQPHCCTGGTARPGIQPAVSPLNQGAAAMARAGALAGEARQAAGDEPSW